MVNKSWSGGLLALPTMDDVNGQGTKPPESKQSHHCLRKQGLSSMDPFHLRNVYNADSEPEYHKTKPHMGTTFSRTLGKPLHCQLQQFWGLGRGMMHM